MNSNYPKPRRMAGNIILLMLGLLLSLATHARATALEESEPPSPRQAYTSMLKQMDLQTSSGMMDAEVFAPKCLVSDASRYVSDGKRLMDDGGTGHLHQQQAPVIYNCPLHAEVISEQPGSCPICGRRLVERSEEELLMHLMETMRPATEHDHSHGSPMVYSCPMHAEVTSSEPGDCPICGMHLVEQAAEALPQDPLPSVKPGAQHDHMHTELTLYNCPMHPNAFSDKPGNCPICGMNLVKKDEQRQMQEQMPSMEPDTQHDHSHAQQTVYSCPTHAEVISEEPGSCPICGKQLIEKSDKELLMDLMKTMQPFTQQEHPHPEPVVYNCPMHPEEVSDKPGRCSICGMFLVENQAEVHETAMPANAMQGVEQAKPSHAMDLAETVEQVMLDTPEEHARKHQDPTYVCPMHPQIMQHEPGNCPICGMNLVVKQLKMNDVDHTAVVLSPAVVQNMGVRSGRVKRGKLTKTIRTQGKVTYDDDRIIQVHPRTPGWIENLYIRTDGVRVERKDDLADYFSPDVLWAQQDYISSLEDAEIDSFSSPGKANPARAFRERSGVDLLRYFKVPSMDIMGLETSMQPRSIIPIKAPQGGVLIEHNVREGTFVTPADNIFTIADLSEVWIMVDIFEHQLAWIRSGLSAEISTPAYPGRTWNGKLDFVYPEVDPRARTLRARVEVRNPGELLMPNMFVQVDLSADTQKQAVLMVPREAVIVTGEREVVVKAMGDGRFQPVEVVSGLWNGRHAEILSGLREGDEIVLSGQFLIDSESSLQASFLRMSE